ncbi:hypothetical protein Tco_0357415 [Tanacetum coccineum]
MAALQYKDDHNRIAYVGREKREAIPLTPPGLPLLACWHVAADEDMCPAHAVAWCMGRIGLMETELGNLKGKSWGRYFDTCFPELKKVGREQLINHWCWIRTGFVVMLLPQKGMWIFKMRLTLTDYHVMAYDALGRNQRVQDRVQLLQVFRQFHCSSFSDVLLTRISLNRLRMQQARQRLEEEQASARLVQQLHGLMDLALAEVPPVSEQRGLNAIKERKKRALADLRYRALQGKPLKQSEVTKMMRNLVKNQWCALNNLLVFHPAGSTPMSGSAVPDTAGGPLDTTGTCFSLFPLLRNGFAASHNDLRYITFADSDDSSFPVTRERRRLVCLALLPELPGIKMMIQVLDVILFPRQYVSGAGVVVWTNSQMLRLLNPQDQLSIPQFESESDDDIEDYIPPIPKIDGTGTFSTWKELYHHVDREDLLYYVDGMNRLTVPPSYCRDVVVAGSVIQTIQDGLRESYECLASAPIVDMVINPPWNLPFLGAKGLTSPEQTATGKGISNPLMAVMVCPKPYGIQLNNVSNPLYGCDGLPKTVRVFQFTLDSRSEKLDWFLLHQDWKLLFFDVATSFDSAVHRVHAVSFDAAVLDVASTVSAACIVAAGYIVSAGICDAAGSFVLAVFIYIC